MLGSSNLHKSATGFHTSYLFVCSRKNNTNSSFFRSYTISIFLSKILDSFLILDHF